MDAPAPAVWRQALGLLLFALALIVGSIATFGGALIAATLTASPPVFLAAGIALGAGAAAALGFAAARLLAQQRCLVTAAATAALSATITIVFYAIFLSKPLQPPVDSALRSLPPGTVHWNLSTGSRIAVRRVEGHGSKSVPPIVYLHGGPGAYSVTLAPVFDALSALAEDGHDIFFYDQVGGGLSARLTDVNQYSLDRHLADLREIHARIGSAEVILIGSSFGASLGVSYLARYPELVAAAVFSGAAPIFHPAWADEGDGKLDEVLSPSLRSKLSQAIGRPRVYAALALEQVNPNAAARFAPDRELGPFFDHIANEFYLPATVCPGDETRMRSDGYGFWSNRRTSDSLWRRRDDPRPLLAAVATPVLVLRGECDYKKVQVAREYTDLIPNAQFQSMEGAGHMPMVDKPVVYLRHVRRFLDEALTSEQHPRPQGNRGKPHGMSGCARLNRKRATSSAAHRTRQRRSRKLCWPAKTVLLCARYVQDLDPRPA